LQYFQYLVFLTQRVQSLLFYGEYSLYCVVRTRNFSKISKPFSFLRKRGVTILSTAFLQSNLGILSSHFFYINDYFGYFYASIKITINILLLTIIINNILHIINYFPIYWHLKTLYYYTIIRLYYYSHRFTHNFLKKVSINQTNIK